MLVLVVPSLWSGVVWVRTAPSVPTCLFSADLSGPVNGESLSQKMEGTEEQERDKSRGPGAGEPEAPSEEAHNK